MTTGMMDFIISSGRSTPMDMMPTPDFAVPYAAPRSREMLSKMGNVDTKRQIDVPY